MRIIGAALVNEAIAGGISIAMGLVLTRHSTRNQVSAS
jgi:hypothetical protein